MFMFYNRILKVDPHLSWDHYQNFACPNINLKINFSNFENIWFEFYLQKAELHYFCSMLC